MRILMIAVLLLIQPALVHADGIFHPGEVASCETPEQAQAYATLRIVENMSKEESLARINVSGGEVCTLRRGIVFKRDYRIVAYEEVQFLIGGTPLWLVKLEFREPAGTFRWSMSCVKAIGACSAMSEKK